MDYVFAFFQPTDASSSLSPLGRSIFTQVVMGKAAYTNIFMTAVAAPQQVGRTVNFSAPELHGSASYYMPELGNEAEQLFAITLTRDDCMRGGGNDKEPFCTQVPESTFNYTEYIYPIQRAYLEPSTKMGADPDETLPPLVLVYETPTPPPVVDLEQHEEADMLKQQ